MLFFPGYPSGAGEGMNIHIVMQFRNMCTMCVYPGADSLYNSLEESLLYVYRRVLTWRPALTGWDEIGWPVEARAA